MKYFSTLTLVLIGLIVFSCKEHWEEHYANNEESVDSKLWDTLSNSSEFSEFVKYIKQFGLDQFLMSSNSKMLFIPCNEVIQEYTSTSDTTNFIKTIKYHMSSTLLSLRSVESKRKLLTLSDKYALIENVNNRYTYDGIDITYSSNLFKDGKYYKISEVAKPKPSLYEFIKLANPLIGEYIDAQDTIILDLEESKPVDFTPDGKTIYDSVTIIKNLFEEEYFPIKEEFRERSATIIIPRINQYNLALDEMALDLGGVFTNYQDIPKKWQLNVLIPVLLNKGVFGGHIDSYDFFTKHKIQNIVGDSILIDFEIDPASKFICSNGITYEYAYFSVEDSLYKGENIIEAESLVDSIGFHQYIWNKSVKVTGRTDFQPTQYYVKEFASNDTVVDVSFESNFRGTYIIEITFTDIFPRNYQLIWRSNYRTSGVYAVYVNDVKPIDVGGIQHTEFDTYTLSGPIFSIIPGLKFWPEKGFNQKDFLVINLTEFGDVVLKLEYLRPGMGTDTGLSIDFVALIPMK